MAPRRVPVNNRVRTPAAATAAATATATTVAATTAAPQTKGVTGADGVVLDGQMPTILLEYHPSIYTNETAWAYFNLNLFKHQVLVRRSTGLPLISPQVAYDLGLKQIPATQVKFERAKSAPSRDRNTINQNGDLDLAAPPGTSHQASVTTTRVPVATAREPATTTRALVNNNQAPNVNSQSRQSRRNEKPSAETQKDFQEPRGRGLGDRCERCILQHKRCDGVHPVCGLCSRPSRTETLHECVWPEGKPSRSQILARHEKLSKAASQPITLSTENSSAAPKGSPGQGLDVPQSTTASVPGVNKDQNTSASESMLAPDRGAHIDPSQTVNCGPSPTDHLANPAPLSVAEEAELRAEHQRELDAYTQGLLAMYKQQEAEEGYAGELADSKQFQAEE